MKSKLTALFIFGFLISGKPFFAYAGQQQQQQQEAERERQRQREEEQQIRAEEAKRRAEERERQLQNQRELDAAKQRLRELRPMTPQERMMRRARMLPTFIKNVGRFEKASAELAAYAASRHPRAGSAFKEIKKKADTIEDRAADLLRFILEWEEAPALPELTYTDSTFQSRAELLLRLTEPVVDKLKLYVESERSFQLDVNLIEDVIRELQIVKEVSVSLQKMSIDQ
jgi:hypothetical protein